MSKTTAELSIKLFMEKVNATYDGKLVEKGGSFKALTMARFSSGVAPLDVILGGGWPFGRVSIIAGNESTGKTLAALKAIGEIHNYCHNCKQYKTACSCGDFTPCPTLFVDLEGSFDLTWALKHGFDENYDIVSRPEYAEQAIDIVSAAIEANAFSLIVVDSLAAMTPRTEIEESTEKWQMGLAARLLNKAFRKWTSALNKVSSKVKAGPALMCLNQVREKIGVMFGDPTTLPGGKGQLFNASIIIRTTAAKVSDDVESKESAWVELNGSSKKNKTYVPRLDYSFNMALKDTDGYKTGEVDNASALIKYGKAAGIVKKIGDGIGFEGGVVVKTEKALNDQIRNKEEIKRKLWGKIITELTGVPWNG